MTILLSFVHIANNLTPRTTVQTFFSTYRPPKGMESEDDSDSDDEGGMIEQAQDKHDGTLLTDFCWNPLTHWGDVVAFCEERFKEIKQGNEDLSIDSYSLVRFAGKKKEKVRYSLPRRAVLTLVVLTPAQLESTDRHDHQQHSMERPAGGRVQVLAGPEAVHCRVDERQQDITP